MQRKLVAGMAALAALAVPVASASASVGSSGNDTSLELTRAVDLRGLTEHLASFQLIASLSGGNRLAGSPGYDRSARYVYARLKLAGYKPRYQEFTYTFNGNRTIPVLSVVGGTSYAVPFQSRTPTSLAAADSGDVTGPLYAIDLRIPSTGGSTSGCETADFPAIVPDNAIALIQRGTCDFVVKIQNAINAGFDGRDHLQRGRRPGPDGLQRLQPGDHGRPAHRDGDVRGRPGARQRRHERADGPPGARQGRHRVAGTAHAERDRGDARPRGQRRGRRSAPRQRRGRPRRQRQRLRLGRDPRDRRGDAQGRAAQPGPLHVVQRQGVGSARFGALHEHAATGRAGQDRRDAELRHARVAELRPLRLRRRH